MTSQAIVLPADALAERPSTAEPIRLLWQAPQGPTFHAWLELVVAARTDP